MKLKLKNRKLLPGREFLLFLFFFFVSCSLWLMLTLNKYYETEITIPLRVRKIPEDMLAVTMESDRITFKIKDRGTVLFNYKMQTFLPITAEYNDFQKQSGRLTLPTSALKKQMTAQLATSSEIISTSPDSIIYYTQESTRKYPVKIDGKITSAIQYEIGDIKIEPDSVWVFGPSSATDTIDYISTEYIEKEELRDSLSFIAKLRDINGVKFSTDKAEISIPITPYTEKTFETEITGIGFPSSYKLKSFPSKAKITFNVNILKIDSIKPTDFKVGILYGDIHTNKSDRVRLTLLKHPEAVRNLRITPTEVEYLIERE